VLVHLEAARSRNEEGESLGLYERFLSEKEIDHQVLHAYGLEPHAPFPRVEDFNAFIVGPTPTLREFETAGITRDRVVYECRERERDIRRLAELRRGMSSPWGRCQRFHFHFTPPSPGFRPP